MSSLACRCRLFAMFALSGCLAAGLFLATVGTQAAQPKGKAKPQPQARKPVAPLPPRSALLTEEQWQKAPLTPLEPGEIDGLIAKELQESKIAPAPLTSDEQFIRRVYLDLTGQLPVPADVDEFLVDRDLQKRGHLIDRLLATDEYARHWARYWREVVSARLVENRPGLAQGFEEWMFEELKKNRSWSQIATAMITAEGEIRFDDLDKNGAAYFLAAHRGGDADNERAAETSRVFLGIQIQCAQCHDHPSDQWKRVQFHELAGYFARMRERPVRGSDGKKVVGFELVSAPRGEHEMPSKEDPKKTFLTYPRFLDGYGPPATAADQERRRVLARQIVSRGNYWFAGAYVNRIWGVLMGQSFYEPVDDMGPKKEAIFPGVLTRLTGAFRGSEYDVKQLFRDVMNSDTYQRQIRLSEGSDQHLHFAAAYPTRLSADALWESVVNVLGRFGPPPREPRKAKAPQGLEAFFKLEFSIDPSLKADEVEGSVAQALFMMNNPTVNQKMRAQGSNLLGRILMAYPDDAEALDMLYLRTLARRPTERELSRCRKHITTASSRADGFEDVLWALMNSTEFQTKR